LQAPDANSVKGGVRLLDETGKVAVEIVGLRFDSIGRTTNLDDWLYEFQWRLTEPPAASAPAESGTWVIFADSGGVGEKLAAQIKNRGDRSIIVSRGDSYERADAEHFRINAERLDDMRQLIEAVTTQGQSPCRAVVHLWSLDADPHDQTDLSSLATAQSLGCNSVLHLVQSLARVESDHLPHLWLATRGAQPAGEESLPLNIAQSPLWGLGRVIAQEHPAFWGGLIDLDPNPEAIADAATQLCKQISSPDGEDQLAFRDGRRYAGRLIRKPRIVALPAPFNWRADGSYLITGGLGELGLSVARWMVEQGARRLILMARTKLPPRSDWNSIEVGSGPANRIAAIRELETMGASVHLVSVDVADEDQLRAYIDSYRAEGWPPIRGVVHAAGVLHVGLLSQSDGLAFSSVLRPKVTRGWLLHQML
jgi:nucleoside-diphosphate-sugar epimerase